MQILLDARGYFWAHTGTLERVRVLLGTRGYYGNMDIIDFMVIMDIMDIMNITNIMNVMNIIAWMAMAGANSALFYIISFYRGVTTC